MIIAMGVMLVTSLLLTAAFLAARGDIHLSHTDTAQKEAYYAALAGVQEFEYEMQVNPDYWQTCGEPTKTYTPQGIRLVLQSQDPAGGTATENAAPPTHSRRRSNRPAPPPTRSGSNRSAIPAMNRRSNTRSSPRSKSRGSSTSSTTRTTRTRIPLCITPPQNARKKHILSETDRRMRADPFRERRRNQRTDAHQRRPLRQRSPPRLAATGTLLQMWSNSIAAEHQLRRNRQILHGHKKLHKGRISGTAEERHQPGNIRERRRQVLRRHRPRTRTARTNKIDVTNAGLNGGKRNRMAQQRAHLRQAQRGMRIYVSTGSNRTTKKRPKTRRTAATSTSGARTATR